MPVVAYHTGTTSDGISPHAQIPGRTTLIMIGALAGDIIGSRFEGRRPPCAGFSFRHPRCRFTDDTVCALAVADAIMTGADFAATLRAFVHHHPDAGYGTLFRA